MSKSKSSRPGLRRPPPIVLPARPVNRTTPQPAAQPAPAAAEAAATLQVRGTALGLWLADGAGLADASPGWRLRVDNAPAPPADAASPGAAAPQDRDLILFEHPATALACALTADDGLDPGSWLDTWCGRAQSLCDAAIGRPGQVQGLQVEVAASLPRPWDEVAGHLGVPQALLAGLRLRQPAAPDAFALALALALAATDARALALYQRLLALQRHSPRVPASLPPAPAQLLQSAAGAWQRARRAARTAAVAAAAAPADAMARQRQLEAELARTRLQAANLAERLEQLQAGQPAAMGLPRPGDSDGGAGPSRRSAEAEWLMLQLVETQAELAQVLGDGAARGTRPAPAPPAGAGACAAEAARMAIAHVRDEAPHRELQVTVHDLRLGARHLPRADLRLVEHNGRPGINLLQGEHTGQLLARWQPSGEESGRPFMLLVPTDTQGRSLIDQLGTGDWQALKALAGLLEQVVRREGQALAPHWATAAARLRLQLSQLPPSLRHDGATARRVDTGGPEGTVEVRLRAAMFGERLLGDLLLTWLPQQPGGGRLRWHAPSEAEALPLASWPVDEASRLHGQLLLPLGDAATAAEKRAQWHALPIADRWLIASLVDALPALVAPLSAPAAGGPGDAALADCAARLRADLERIESRSGLQRLARGLLGKAGKAQGAPARA